MTDAAGWLCRREYATVPEGERVVLGSYRLHRAGRHDLHRIIDGWSVELNAAGDPRVDDGEPVFEEIVLDATEAE